MLRTLAEAQEAAAEQAEKQQHTIERNRREIERQNETIRRLEDEHEDEPVGRFTVRRFNEMESRLNGLIRNYNRMCCIVKDNIYKMEDELLALTEQQDATSEDLTAWAGEWETFLDEANDNRATLTALTEQHRSDAARIDKAGADLAALTAKLNDHAAMAKLQTDKLKKLGDFLCAAGASLHELPSNEAGLAGSAVPSTSGPSVVRLPVLRRVLGGFGGRGRDRDQRQGQDLRRQSQSHASPDGSS